MPLTLNAGAGGGDLATQAIAAEHFQEIKVILGADGVNDGGVSDANPMPIDDAGGSITVDGTVAVTGVATAANQTTEITSLQLLDDVVFAEDVAATAADKGVHVLAVRRDADTTLVGATNDYASLQVDANGYLKVEAFDGGDSHTVDNAGTFAVQATSVIPGTGATNLGKAIDSAAGATDTGVALLAVRDDALSALTPAETDYVPLRVNSTGALHVTGGGGGTEFNVDSAVGATPAGSLALVVRKDAATALANADGDATALQVDAAGALRVTGGGGGTEYVVNAAAPADPTGATFVMERDDALSALTEVEGDWTNPRSNADGALWVAVEVSALPAGAATAAAQTTAQTALDLHTTALQLIDNIVKSKDGVAGGSDAGVPALVVRDDALTTLTPVDGDYEHLRINSVGAVWSEIYASALPAGAATAAKQDTEIASLSVLDDWDETDRAKVNTIAGQVGVQGAAGASTALTQRVALATDAAVVNGMGAHDAAIAGSPLTAGGVAIDIDDTAPPNRVSAEADSVRQGMDRDGTLFAHPHGPQVWSYHSDGSSALTDASVHAAPAAGLSLYVTDIVVSTGAATAMNVFFEEGASKILGPYYLEAVAGRGLALHFQTPKKITAATALTVTTSAAIAQSVDVTGFTAQG